MAADNVNNTVTLTTTNVLEGAGAVECDGLELGSFTGGVRVTKAQTENFIKADYGMGNIRGVKMGVEITVETELEEATLENLAIAWGIHSSSVLSGASSKTVTLTFNISNEEIALTFKGMSATDNTKNRTFTLSKVISVGSSTTTLQRGTKTTIPVTFHALMNSSESFGTIVDTTQS